MDKRVAIISVFIVIVVLSSSAVAFSQMNYPTRNDSQETFLNDAAILGISSSASLNWAGYVVTGSDITNVSGSFTVPSIAVSSSTNGNFVFSGHGHGPSSSVTTYAAFWAGIDGYSSSTVEQAGILMEDSNGVVTYSAWYEFYPASPVYAPWSPSAGNQIGVKVQYYANDTMVATVNDTTTGHTFSSPYEPASSYQRNSAEWIAEAPSSARGILPLADFGTVYFGQNNTGISNTNYATVGGTYGSIGYFADKGFTVVELSMVNRNGSLKASPSSLSADGTSFSVKWYSS